MMKLRTFVLISWDEHGCIRDIVTAERTRLPKWMRTIAAQHHSAVYAIPTHLAGFNNSYGLDLLPIYAATQGVN